MALTLQVYSQRQVSVLACNGIIVFGEEASSLRAHVKELVSQAGSSSPSIVLDLTHVQYIDSGGVGTLVGLLTSARSAGGDLKLAGVNERVRQVLKITHLIEVFQIHTSIEDAINAFRPGVAGAAARK